MKQVPRRDRATLLPIIYDNVAPGSTIMTDGWRAYFALNASIHQYEHHWVNHKFYFVDPDDDQVHTQSIESTWGALKRSLKHLAGVRREQFQGYMDNYLFRRAHSNNKIMHNILFWLIHYFPAQVPINFEE